MKTKLSSNGMLAVAAISTMAMVMFAQGEIGQFFPRNAGADEDGSESKPYTISCFADLDAIRLAVASGSTTAGIHFKQTADIDMTAVDPFEGIGVYNSNPDGGVPFAGVYDGAGHMIRNVDFTPRSYGGIFNQVNGGTIKNLVVSNITCSLSVDDAWGCAIVGNAGNGATLQNLVAAGSFGTAEKPCTHNVAGIVIRLSPGAVDIHVKDCTNNAALFGTYTKMAGICVLIQRVSTGGIARFEGCVNNGILTMPSGDNAGRDGLAGIVAFVSVDTSLKDCANWGSMHSASAEARVGELVGYVGNVTIMDLGGNEAYAYANMIGYESDSRYVVGFTNVITFGDRVRTTTSHSTPEDDPAPSVVTTIVQQVETPYALTNSVADRAIASVTVDGDRAIDEFVLKDGKVYDCVLYINNTAEREVTLTLPAGNTYKAFKGMKPLKIPALSQNILTITRVADTTFLVSREELETLE